ncbi:unnamed protein product [Notodromas monacha]|uniref:C2 domain-containing protein n=1 Tax=Notodromas monacha TaxID=399045 RepID=A0A7R9BM13_9CRUS|nr:unnamed protein product [Notodromas monacha]CAG0916872.1 unnamed protein product [Notodromas monacha]
MGCVRSGRNRDGGVDPHRANLKNGARLSGAGEDVKIEGNVDDDRDDEESAPSSNDGDGSDSVGSESDGQPSPERKRKKVMKPRNHRRGSQENLLRSCSNDEQEHDLDACPGLPPTDGHLPRPASSESCPPSLGGPTSGPGSSGGSSSNSYGDDAPAPVAASILPTSARNKGSSSEEEIVFDKNDGQFDTIKRRKKKKVLLDFSSDSEIRSVKQATFLETERKRHSGGELEVVASVELATDSPKDCAHKLDTDDIATKPTSSSSSTSSSKKHRDSGFIGSSDDLLAIRASRSNSASPAASDDSHSSNKSSASTSSSDVPDVVDSEQKTAAASSSSSSSAVSRKDSFNNWSSDEETNLMMSRMRAFFKNMISSANKDASARGVPKVKPPQLVNFEHRLTSLMKTVPGINDEQVKEIVEYLSSEDTWSDSYDSSDYTSSDLEGACASVAVAERPEDLQHQISASCQEIIEQFDGAVGKPHNSPPSPTTTLSTSTLATTAADFVPPSPGGASGGDHSPPMFARVMQHIGTRLVALMHEVSETGSEHSEDFWASNQLVTSSPKPVPASIKTNAVDSQSDDEDGVTPKASPCSTLKTALNTPSSSMFYSSFSPNGTPKASPHSTLKTPIPSSADAVVAVAVEATTKPAAAAAAGAAAAVVTPVVGGGGESASEGAGVSAAPSLSSSSGTGSEVTIVEKPIILDASLLASLKAAAIIGPIDDPDAPPPRERYVGDPEEELALINSLKLSEDADSKSGYQPSWLTEGRKKGRTGWRVGLGAAKRFKSKSQDALVVKAEKEAAAGSASGDELDSPVRKTPQSTSRLPALISRHRTSAASPVAVESRQRPTPTHQPADKVSVFGFMSASPASAKNTASSSVSPASVSVPANTPAVRLTPATVTMTSNSGSGPVSSSGTSSGTSTPTGVRSARYRPMGEQASPAMTPKNAEGQESSLLRRGRAGPGSSGNKLTYSVQGTGSPKPRSSAALARLTSPALSVISKTLTPPESPAASSRGSDGSVGTSSPPMSPRKISTMSAPAVISPAWSESESEDLDRYFAYQRGKSSVREESMSVNSTLSDLSGFTVTNIVPVKGEVQFSVQFNEQGTNLEIHIKQCRELAAVDLRRNRSDPYVKVYLLPDRTKTGKRKTKVKKHTLNPIFDEVLRFPGTLEDLMARTLSLSVWHSDMFGRNDFLGEVTLPLKLTDLANPIPKWYKLQEKLPSNDDAAFFKGSLIVALKFVPAGGSPYGLAYLGGPPPGTSERGIDVPPQLATPPFSPPPAGTGTLHVLVKEGRDVVGARSGVPLDAFLKCWLLPDRSQKQKSSPVKRSSSPNWNHTFTFGNVTLSDLRDRSVEITVWDHDRLTSNSVIGGVRFNLGTGKHFGRPVDWMDARGEEEALWRSMMERPGLWVQACLPLRCTSSEKLSQHA